MITHDSNAYMRSAVQERIDVLLRYDIVLRNVLIYMQVTRWPFLRGSPPFLCAFHHLNLSSLSSSYIFMCTNKGKVIAAHVMMTCGAVDL
jgi:hypothetical protein